MSHSVAIFSPFSNIWEHTYPEALLAHGLQGQGWDVQYLRCDGLFQNHCVAMAAAGVNEFSSVQKRQQVCSACRKRRSLITNAYEFPSVLIEQWLTSEDRELVQNTLESTTITNWTSVEIDGIPLGRYATYEMWLNNKVADATLPPELWGVYLGQLENTLLAFLAGKNFIAQNKPDVVFVYNDHYSVNHAFTAAAELAGVPAYTIHGGWHMVRRAESMSMMRAGYSMANIFETSGWKAYEKLPLTSADVSAVTEHFLGLWEASSAFAYSSALTGEDAASLRARLGIAKDKKVLLAPMSSEDEILGIQLIGAAPESKTQKSLFANQFEWVDYLLEYARKNADVHVILRLHPRMFPNKRELQLSPVVAAIMALKPTAPKNVTFNVPDDNVGLYDLAQIVDVLLNYTSTVGAELMALGIPVVVPSNSRFYTYPSELNLIGKTTAQYGKLIRQAITAGWSLENSRLAFRWFSFLFTRVAAGFSETYTSRPTAIRPKKPGFRLWLWKKLVYFIIQFGPLIRERLSLRRRDLPASTIALFDDVLVNNLESVSDSQLWKRPATSLEEETAALTEFFRSLANDQWSGVTESNSLAGRVRAYLAK